MTAIERVIAAARAEVGYIEKASNAQLDDKTANAGKGNWTKYARDLDGIGHIYNGRKNGYDWCDVFVDWCFITTFGPEIGMKLLCQSPDGLGAGVKYSAQYYQSKGRFKDENPKPGDQIFFWDGKVWKHTGLVVEVKDGKVYTVEGNTTGASGVVANGGGVALKSYSLTSDSIAGYGRPDYSIVPVDEAESNRDAVDLTDIGGTGDAHSAWADDAVEFCKRNGLFAGDGKGNYGWQRPITREEAAQLAMNLLKLLNGNLAELLDAQK